MSRMHKQQKKLSIGMLIIYMITALLFLTSVKLHIHTGEHASAVDHGQAVSISSITSDLATDSISDEVNVSPDSLLKLKQGSESLYAVFLLIAVMLAVLCRTYIGRLRESHAQLPFIPFHGTPPLRAPPL
jgi:hypothetical protein